VEARLGALPVLAASRRWRDVETTARQILDRDPASYTASLRLAYALYSLGRYPEAEVVYRKLAALYPGDLEVRSGVGWSLLKMGKKADAAIAFASIVDVAPKNALALDGLKLARAER
jgi:Flp pilus assembly protein TadD